jgi:hypothetical protein
VKYYDTINGQPHMPWEMDKRPVINIFKSMNTDLRVCYVPSLNETDSNHLTSSPYGGVREYLRLGLSS